MSALVVNFASKYLLHELRESIETTVASRRVRTISSNLSGNDRQPSDPQPVRRHLNMLEKVRNLFLVGNYFYDGY